ncbi:MAG: hypothetical protein JWO86_5027 [Myxococcaceae bacterium]|nr:hypothetical protein [Myxococcaceae bacterium]
MSRTLNDDFDDDDLPSGSLDLEKGSGQVGGGAPSTYGNDGIDFDDDLYGSDDPGANKALELDLPHAPAKPSGAPSASMSRAPAASSKAPGSMGSMGSIGSMAGPMDVPDLAFDAAPQRQAPPPPRSSGSLPAVRTSGMHPAAGQSGQHPAAGGIPSAPPSSSRNVSGTHAPFASPAAPPSEGGHHGFAPPAPSSSSGLEDPSSERGPHSAPMAQMAPLPPPKPTAAAVIAKYPDAPSKITQAPMYAVRVVLRQLELRTDLESLRRRRSPDVPLYEAALRAYDTKTFRLGMAINCAALVVATFIFFLPVMIRFIRAD